MPQKRDPRVDPRPGDVVRLPGEHIATIITREVRRPNQHEYGLGTAKNFIRYRLAAFPGVEHKQAVSGWKKRCRVLAEVLHVADCAK